MKKSNLVLALVLGLACALPAVASDALDYSYIQGTYQYTTNSNLSSRNGFGGEFSADLGPVFVVGSASRTLSNNYLQAGNDFRVGLGVHVPLADNADIYGVGSLINQDYNTPKFSDFTTASNWGYAAEGGVRVALNNVVNFKAGVSEEKVNNTDASWNTYGVAGVNVNLTKNVAVVGEFKGGAGEHVWQTGLRYQF